MPQIRALETYWYLRLIEKTPHVFELYTKHFLSNTELLASLGLHSQEIQALVIDHGVDALWDRIRTDDKFSHENKLEALRETLRLDYSSYIFALAMGAGKTILIGAIIATEFAMALEYPRGPFVQNALVFAPGKTILESLRQLAEIPFDKILPPRLYKPFAASVRLTFTRDGEKDLPVIHRSAFNVVVTNTEKIRIQKPTGRNGQNKLGLLWAEKQKQEEEIASPVTDHNSSRRQNVLGPKRNAPEAISGASANQLALPPHSEARAPRSTSGEPSLQFLAARPTISLRQRYSYPLRKVISCPKP